MRLDIAAHNQECCSLNIKYNIRYKMWYVLKYYFYQLANEHVLNVPLLYNVTLIRSFFCRAFVCCAIVAIIFIQFTQVFRCPVINPCI